MKKNAAGRVKLKSLTVSQSILHNFFIKVPSSYLLLHRYRNYYKILFEIIEQKKILDSEKQNRNSAKHG